MSLWIAFDMDGTLFDCGGIIAEAYARASQSFTAETGVVLPVPDRAAIMSVIGNTADMFFPKLFPGLSPDLYTSIDMHCTRELSAMVRQGKGILYDGVFEMFEELTLKGHKLLIASNGQAEYLAAILESRGLVKYLASPVKVVNYKDVCTKSDILRWYRENLGIPGGSLVMAGDRASDMKAARDNGAYFIGCAFGHAGDGEVRGADRIVHSVGEISGSLPG